GARVDVRALDIADRAGVEQLFADLDAASCAVHGIIHAAGVLDDGALLAQTWARYVHVMRPKVLGAAHLHAVTLTRPLDFFVVFSSMSAVMGPGGQANYAAANAYLDGLAHHRRALGLPAVSIDWGSWAGGGMAESGGEVQERRHRLGFQDMAPEHSLRALAGLLRAAPTQCVVVAVQWSTLMKQLGPEAPALFEAWHVAASTREDAAAMRILLAELPAEKRPPACEAAIVGVVRKVLG